MAEYFSFYLICIIVASLVLSWFAWKYKLLLPRYFVVAVLLVFLVPAVFIFIYFIYFSSVPEVVVPDLRGITYEEGLSRLERLDLKGRYAGQVYEAGVPQGCVASQRPEGGRRVKIGRIVNLIVSVLDKKAIVPNLLGRSHNDIEVLLAARGLVSGEVSFDYVPGVEGGVVLTQNPLPDEEIDPGAAVAVTVSSSWEIGPSDSRTEKAGQVESATKEKEGGFKLW